MANTSAIFKGSRTKLLTKDGLLLEAGQSIKVTDGAADEAVMVSDAQGVVGLSDVPALTDQENTGFVSWGGVGNYYSYSSGTFTVLRAGVGRIKGQKITWAGGESVAGLSANKGYLIGFSATNTLVAIDISTLENSSKKILMDNYLDTYTNNVMVFGIWTDGANPVIVKEAHEYKYNTDISIHDHFRLGQTFSFSGAQLSVLNAAARTIQTSGEDLLDDHGLETRVPDAAGAAIDAMAIFQNAGGLAQGLNRRTFTVSGITTEPTAGAVYTNNGSSFTVMYTTLTGVAPNISGTIATWTSSGNNNPSASGTLTKSSGTGDATIAFSAYSVPSTISTIYAPAGVPTSLGTTVGSPTRFGIVAVYASKDDLQTPSTAAPTPKYFQVLSNTAYSSAANAANSIGTGASPDLTQFILPTEMKAIEIVLNGFVIVDGNTRAIAVTATNGFVAGVKTTKAVLGASSLAGAVSATTANNVSLDTTNFNGRLTSSEVNVQLAMDKLDDNVTSPVFGGTGVANNAAATLTRTGNHDLALTTTAPTSLTLPTTGTVATTAVVTTGFDGNLSSNENTIQNAFDKIDNFRLNGQETNYIENRSATNVITGWFAVGDLAVSRSTTASELPRENTTLTGIKIVADADTQSAADYVYYDFTLDDVDLNGRIMKLKWDQKVLATYAAGQLEVVITSQADRATALVTPFTTAIPAQDGTFQTYFLAPSTTTLSLVIRATADMTANDGICISDVVVGPNVQVQGSAIGGWKAFTPTGSWTTNTTYTGFYREVGDSIEVRVSVDLTGAPTASALVVSLPTGFTANTSRINTGDHTPIGLGGAIDAGTGYVALEAYYYSSSQVIVKFHSVIGGAGTYIQPQSVTNTAPMTFANGDGITIEYSLPVNEFSSNVTLLSNPNIPFELAGAVQAFAGATAPNGWAICDGAAVSRSTYAQLFSRIGTTWGTGDGSTTFNLPDLRETTLVGVGTRGAGVAAHDTYTLGQFKDDQLQGHYHNAVAKTNGGASGNVTIWGNNAAANEGLSSVSVYGPVTDGTNGTPRTGTTTHGKQAGVNYIIRMFDAGIGAGACPISSANIVGRTDGVAPASGMVGETITVAATGQTATWAGSTATAVICSYSLPAGSWEIHAFDSLYNQVRGSSGASAGGSDIYDSTGAAILAEGRLASYWGSTATSNDSEMFPTSLYATLDFTGANKTIQFRVKVESATGTPTNATCNSRGYGKLIFKRKA